jgi:endonuclease YncB( thermonuclease family)
LTVRRGDIRLAFALLALLVLATASAGRTSAPRTVAPPRGSRLHGTVVKVHDGDSMDVRIGGAVVGVRTFGVDSPERGQPWSARAKAFTSGLIGNQPVTIVVHDVDRYHRVVGDVVLADGRSLGRELLQAGLAWCYRRYAHDPELVRLEDEARAARRGLWSEPHPVPPWQFRRAERAR